jgi:hypothetical protein
MSTARFMKRALPASASALVLLTGALVSAPPSSAAGAAIPVVNVSVQGDQVMSSMATVTPGVIEFHVGDTLTIPGPQGGPDNLVVVASQNLEGAIAQLPALFQGNPGDPASLAAAAQAERNLHGLTTMYGGGGKGTVWQVRLHAGTYYVISPQAMAMGLAKPTTLTVAGGERGAPLHATSAIVMPKGPVGHNKWVTVGLDTPGNGWLRFSNRSHEIHFMDLSGVKASTTDAMVKKALMSPAQPKFFTGESFAFDVISPGVSVAVKAPIKPGKYLLDCFMPSEADGMPHALMGMWKLVWVA